MPCMDGGPRTDWYQEYVKIGRLLCTACRIIAKHGLEGKMTASLAAWWTAHKEEDRKREEREAEERAQDKVRQSALNKLTEEEIMALNLNLPKNKKKRA